MFILWLLSVISVFLSAIAINIVEDHGYVEDASHIENNTDNDYPEYQGDSYYFEPDVSNLTLRKCFCNVNQAWNGTFCQDTNTVVAIANLVYKVVAVPTNSFGNVSIGEATCPGGLQLEMHFNTGVNSPPVEFYILESGNFLWNGYAYDQYCVENTYGPDGVPNQWLAQVCLQPPVVPECCPEDSLVDSTGACVTSQNKTAFSPPVFVAGHHKVRPSVKNRRYENVSCRETDETIVVELDSENVYLVFDPFKPFLVRKSSKGLKEIIYDYCVGTKARKGNDSIYTAKYCNIDPMKDHEAKCKGRTCIRKCYCNNEFQDAEGCRQADEEPFRPVFHHPANLTPGAKPPEDLTIVHGKPLCPSFYRLDPQKNENDRFHLLQNGYLHSPGLLEPLPPTSYCLDHFPDPEPDGQLRFLPLVCFPPPRNTVCTSLETYLYPTLLLISAGFLVVTLLVYISVPELHAKVHGKCLISHVASLLVAYISLFTVNRVNRTLDPIACKFMASVTHISFLAAFFWLNVMCFDIWWTLKSMHPVPETGEQSRLRFKLYSLYSWGCSLIIAIVSIIIQSLPDDYDVIRPGFGDSKCWFDNYKSQWIYFYSFVLVLVVINIIFFIHVAVILIVAHSDSVLQRTRQKNRERMWLYVKLFIVMGVTWLAEAISWQEGFCEAWIVTDIINSLQGLLIFLIFTCKKNLLKKMMNKCEAFLRHLKDSVRSGRPQTSNTPAVGNGTSEQLSHSLSEMRSNHSATSHRTLQSQLSSETDAANSRKISTGSSAPGMGHQPHTHRSIQMDPNTESSSPRSYQRQISTNTVTLPVDEGTEESQVYTNDGEENSDQSVHSDSDHKEQNTVIQIARDRSGCGDSGCAEQESESSDKVQKPSDS